MALYHVDTNQVEPSALPAKHKKKDGPTLRLSDFIRANIEPILAEWVKFAREINSAEPMSLDDLRDSAKGMLLDIADDLDQAQTPHEQQEKSKGRSPTKATLTDAHTHGSDRMASGFDVNQLMAEFRALRASVIRLWTRANPEVLQTSGEDLIRFNEALDQAITESLIQFAEDKERQTFLFDTILSSSPDLAAILDVEGKLMYANKTLADIFNLSPADLVGRNLLDLGFPTAAKIQAGHQNVVRNKKPHQEELTYVLPDGNTIVYEYSFFPVINKEGNIEAVAGIARDITDRRKAEENLQLAAAVYKESSEAMMITDENNNLIAINQAFQDMTGFEPHEVLGKNARILKSGSHDPSFYAEMQQQINSTGRFKGEIWNRKKNGELFAALLTINTINKFDGSTQRHIGLMSDITEKKKSDEVIWTQANFDPLTGLPNRRLFRDHLQQQVRLARRDRVPLALMFLDLDAFKDVNDMLGHDTGDELLKEAAHRLKKCVRDSDLIARLGGDEFTIVLTELYDPSNADRVARHILRRLSEPFQLNGESANISASIGITFCPQDATEVEELLKNADQAMYAAKEQGKNQFHYFTREMQDAAIAHMHLINDLRHSLESNQFTILYQPIVELSTGIISKAEALIRWNHPTRGLINPIDFISAAEDTGMISSFGDWIFHEAAKQVALWREKYHPEFQISVNISPVQFKKEGIDPAIWFEHLKNLGLPGQGIVVEITEGLLLEASAKVTDQLLMLRDAGIEVALDDFGTGYSSLSYLKKFDIDYLKIDRTFVQNLAAGSDDLALCEAIIVMAHKLGIKVIAEGIETTEQCRLLRSAGCDYGQGYLFSRPVSPEGIESMLNTALNAF